MESTKIWNDIVEHYNKNLSSKEEVLQNDWELIFSEMFRYSKFYGELKSHKTIHLGSSKHVIPDIVIGTGERDLFDVELKQYTLPISVDMEQQLKSYMDLLHVSVGILVCSKLHIFVYAFSENKLKTIEIDFVENNPDGIRFVELFRKGCFDQEKIEAFIDSKNAFAKNVELIKAEINDKTLRSLLINYLGDTYSDAEIEVALRDFNITVSEKKVENLSSVVVGKSINTGITDGNYKQMLRQTIRNVLNEYHNASELIYVSNSPDSYIRFQTARMLSVLPNSKNIPGSWGTGARFYFWFGEADGRSFKACFELGGDDLDEETAKGMRRIIESEKPNDKRSAFKFKRIYTKKHEYTSGNLVEVVKAAINDLLRWEEYFFKRLK